MKNLSEYREELSAPRVPRSGGHDPFRFRKIATYDRQKKRSEKEWRRHEPDEYRAARLRKLILGRLPGRAAKYGCADFDLSERCEYAGDDGAAVTGGELAGIAAHIVRCAKHPVDYLFSLRSVPAKFVEPIKAYLRVKLAMGRLKAEIEANASYSFNFSCPAEVPAQDRDDSIFCDQLTPVIPDQRRKPCRAGTSRGQDDVEGEGHLNASLSWTPRRSYEVPVHAVCKQTTARDDSYNKPSNPPPSFKWHISPAKTHNFKELTKTYGYDPRGTSVYWIEKRANALRRRWKKNGQQMRGETLAPKLKARPNPAPLSGENYLPKIKHFTPADIDYNSVWPPVKMPDGPPKAAEHLNASFSSTPRRSCEVFVLPKETLNQVRDDRFMMCDDRGMLGDNSLHILRTAFERGAVEARLELGHTARMSLLTRILTAGARLFGPPPRVDENGRPGQIEPAGVTAALIALGAKMAKSDGVVTTDEIDAFKRVFQAAPEDEPMIGRFFDLARQTTAGFERYAAIIAKRYRAQPAALEDVLDGLFHIALADSVVTDDEMAFLRRVSEIFGFSELEFNRIKAAHMGRAADDPYLILGIDERVTDSELKRAYRRMAAANHPDRLMARGLPKELIGLANHKMSMINTAYEEIKRQRKSLLPKLHGPNT